MFQENPFFFFTSNCGQLQPCLISMQTHLLLREYPRALALRPTVLEEEPSGVLVFEEYKGSDNRAVAKLIESSEFEDQQWRILNSRPVFGCLGLITIQSGN